MADPFRLEWKGTQLVMEQLRDMPKRIRQNELRNAVRRAATYVLGQMKGAYNAKQRTGLLYKSLGTKVSQRVNGNLYARIGPRRGFRARVVIQATRRGERIVGQKVDKEGNIRLNKKGRAMAAVRLLPKARSLAGQIINPVSYAHLVEKGHKGKHPAGPRAFILPAIRQSEDGVYGIIRAGIQRGIERAGMLF